MKQAIVGGLAVGAIGLTGTGILTLPPAAAHYG